MLLLTSTNTSRLCRVDNEGRKQRGKGRGGEGGVMMGGGGSFGPYSPHYVPLVSIVPLQANLPSLQEGPITHLGNCIATSGKRSSSFAPRSSVCSRERYERGLSMTKDALSREL